MRYDAIIIGGGVIGLSVAWRLAERGVRAIVLERNTIGAGSSSRGVGGVRRQFTTPINIALSQLSLPVFSDLGESIEFHQHGYLYLALSNKTLAALRRHTELQRACGAPVELLSPDEVHARCPYLRIDDVRGAAFCSSDGYVTPELVIPAYAERARAAGAAIAEGVEVTGIRMAQGYVDGVSSNAGVFEAPVVVNAAGPWAAHIAALAGIDLPVVPLKRQVWLVGPTNAVPPTAPLTIDADTGWHFRPRQGGLLFAMPGNEQLGDERLDLDMDLAQRMFKHGRRRLPDLRAGLARGWAGLYEMTPDLHPVLGMAKSLPGFYLACGFSGHGLMHSPAAGLLLAALICGEQPAVDIAPLALERFSTGQLLKDESLL